ncbi:hypothetical protein FZEAL_1326 [Fusarium zealandicum]|uniref:Uncharacterized protein n=1 Tax=Fusarium zealandicum TaxID=1053134 RepID=A0A8H4UTT4_9HYPO|nr:hypothetical protein FZEAL_1326 [Fusarium zealandicum]
MDPPRTEWRQYPWWFISYLVQEHSKIKCRSGTLSLQLLCNGTLRRGYHLEKLIFRITHINIGTMAPDQDVYRKVGRGGAGNYYAATKADDASRDLEAQDLATTLAPPPDRASAQVPARAGRGGAGNYVNPADLPDAREQSEMADKTAAAISASLKRNQHQRGGLAGRGGAGNWKADEEQAREDERTRGEEMERKAKEAVEKGLKMPEKVHHGQERREI